MLDLSLEPTSTVSSAIAVVSKCPIPGKSKTRLIPMLGEEGSAALAKAMLSDVILTLDKCDALSSVRKILLYAPGDEEGLVHMEGILQELGVQRSRDDLNWPVNSWLLLPLKSVGKKLQSSNLGDLLEDSLIRARESLLRSAPGAVQGSIAYLGMDSPSLPLEDLASGLRIDHETAILCPADDGGYGMLTVPAAADPKQTFACGVRWSHPLTAVSQLKALTDQRIAVRIGRLMHDIDELEDVERLVERVKLQFSSEDPQPREAMLLETSSTSENLEVSSLHQPLSYTAKALIAAKLLIMHEK